MAFLFSNLRIVLLLPPPLFFQHIFHDFYFLQLIRFDILKNHYFCPILSHKRFDTLGAGDAFASGFTVARIKSLPLKTALLYGTLNAGNAVMQPGAQNGLLTADQMAKALKKSEVKVKSTKL